MKAQEILAKYNEQKQVKNAKLDEIITLIKDDKFNELLFNNLIDAKLDKYDILDTNLSEQILKNEELHKKLFMLKIKLTLNDDLVKELLEKNAMYMQTFSGKIQTKHKDFILKNSCLGFRYLCDELKYDFDFLKKYIKSEKERLNNTSEYYNNQTKINSFFNSALKKFKANQNYNKELLECFTLNDIEIYAYNKERFKLKRTFTLKEILSDIEKYKKIILNENNELKKTYYDLVLSEFSSLNDDELKTFILTFATKLKTFNNLLKNYDFCIRLAKLDELLSCIVSNVEIEKLSFSKEQINNLIKLNPKYEKLAKNYEKLIISFSDDATKILEINSLIDDESISELINLAYTKELEYNYLHLSRSIENKDFVSKHSEHNLIINNSLNTATLIRYDDTNKTTEKLIYSFEKAAI